VGDDAQETAQMGSREALHSIRRAANLILTNLERAAGLVESFKQVSVDQVSEARRSFNIIAYVRQVVRTLEPQLRKGDHRIIVDGDPDLLAETYPGVIAQILSNLVMNALNHGLEDKRGGEIQISCRALGRGRWRLSVADNGCGVDPTLEGRIFEPFFTTRRRRGGTGLGLHIVQNLVILALHGQIRINRSHRPGLRIDIDMPTIGSEARPLAAPVPKLESVP
jgi:signal transduction histidine kinase